jgi:predicted transcriptional regulator
MSSGLRERIIELLREHQGSHIPQAYIHRALGVSKSRVSEILSELEKEGLISRISIGRSKVIQVHPGISEKSTQVVRKNLRLGIVYSSEYLFLPWFIKKLARRGFRVEVVIFRDGLKATRALAEGVVDLALSPLPGQLYMYPLYRTYKLILAGVKGGFRVVYLGDSGPIYSSMISTMDYARHRAVGLKMVDANRTIYYGDPSELLRLKKSRGYIVTWHPVYYDLEKRGFKSIYSPEDLDVQFCCTLGVSNTVDDRLRRIIQRDFQAALSSYEKNPERGLEYYASITGIDLAILKTAVSEYRVVDGLNGSVVDELTSSFAPLVPARDVYRSAIFEDDIV